MPSCCHTALLEIRLWGMRTTVEGLPNLMAARTVRTRVFWAVLLTCVTCLGLAHLVMSIRNFQTSGVASEVTIDGAAAEFPCVTVCSLKPVSESLLKYYGPVVHRYLDVNWGYFDRWFEQQRRQGDGESIVAYRQRMRLIFFQMMEVMWISDDTRDLSLTDRTTILECSFNGAPCNHNNFSLLQHHQFWNCYTFTPHWDLRFANPAGENAAGLTFNIFSDSNFFESTYRTSTSYSWQHGKQDYHTDGLSLRQFLNGTPGEFPLNMALVVDEFSTDGVQIVLHPRSSYPMFHQSRFTVKNSMSATHHVLSVEQNKLNRPDSPCNESATGTVRYAVAFGSRPGDLVWQEFAKGVEDILHLLVQQQMYRQCHCYSHRMPFSVDTTALCYYVPPEHRKAPTQEVLARIYCHDAWLQRAEDASHRLGGAASNQRERQPCRRTYREVQLKTSRWPSDEDLLPASVLYFVHRLANGTEFVGPNDPHEHRIFNFSDPLVVAAATQAGRQRLLSREAVAIQSVLRPSCGHMVDFNESHIAGAAGCINTEAVRRNIMKINVRLASPGATVYNESFAYGGMEFMSEVGGILGLWFGVSVLTFFELIELVYLIIRGVVDGQPSAAGAYTMSVAKARPALRGRLVDEEHEMSEIA